MMPNRILTKLEWHALLLACIPRDTMQAWVDANLPPAVRDRRALPPDGPDIGADVPGGGAI